jgi:hypothetical protein
LVPGDLSGQEVEQRCHRSRSGNPSIEMGRDEVPGLDFRRRQHHVGFAGAIAREASPDRR